LVVGKSKSHLRRLIEQCAHPYMTDIRGRGEEGGYSLERGYKGEEDSLLGIKQLNPKSISLISPETVRL
jgi:hypothetical protein